MSKAEKLIDKLVEASTPADKDKIKAEYKKLSAMPLTSVEGIWRRMDIGPVSDRPEDKEDIVSDIMSFMFGDDWQRSFL